MNIWSVARHELRHKRWGLLAYCLGAIAFLALYVSIYPSIQHQSKMLEKALSAYPKQILAAFDLASFNLDTLEKYLAAEMFSFVWPIMAIALVLGRAGSSLAGEIEQGTMGLLLSLPIGRRGILAGKYLAGWVVIVIFAVLSILAVIPMAVLANLPYQAGALLQVTGLSILFMGAVFSLGVLASVFFSERSRVYGLISGLLLIMYVMNLIAKLVHNLNWLKYGSLFYYFNATEVVTGAAIRWRSVWTFGGVIIVATLLAVWRFQRRDITV